MRQVRRPDRHLVCSQSASSEAETHLGRAQSEEKRAEQCQKVEWEIQICLLTWFALLHGDGTSFLMDPFPRVSVNEVMSHSLLVRPRWPLRNRQFGPRPAYSQGYTVFPGRSLREQPLPFRRPASLPASLPACYLSQSQCLFKVVSRPTTRQARLGAQSFLNSTMATAYSCAWTSPMVRECL